MYVKAQELIEKMFKDKVDKAGNPYTNHLYGVSNQGENEYEKTLGLLHDILEDTTMTSDELINLGFPKDLVKRIELLTKNKDENYDEYIKRILKSRDKIAIKVKIYDLKNNLEQHRLALLSYEKQVYFKNKYIPVLQKMEECLLS